jgi:hypothetical protein
MTYADILARERQIARRERIRWSLCRVYLRSRALAELQAEAEPPKEPS